VAGSQPPQVTYTFDRDLPASVVGTILYTTDANQNGANSVFERNTVQDQSLCCRGMTLAGFANSSVRGNYIRHSAFAGIHGEFTTPQGEPPTSPLVNWSVYNNVIDGTNMTSDWWWYEFGSIQAVTLTSSGDLMTSSPHSNLNVTNNFIADPGRSGIFLANIAGGSASGNYLLDPNDRLDLANADGARIAEAHLPVAIDATSSGIVTTNNTVDNTSGRMFVTDTQYRELAAYAPGSTIRLNAYNLGTLANPTVTLTDADGATTALAGALTTTHALDFQLPLSVGLGGAFVTLTAAATKYFGTLFIDSQDNVPAVNGCTYETSLSSSSPPSSAGSVPVLVVTQAGCPYQAVDGDSFVNPGAGATGTAVISVSLAGNTGPARSTIIEIAGRQFTLTQAAGFSPCDLKQNGSIGVANVQLMISQALGAIAAVNDLDGDGAVNVVDVQIESKAALGSGCAAK